MEKENTYKKLMKKCCIETLQNLEASDNLIDSLVIGIKILEVEILGKIVFFKYL